MVWHLLNVVADAKAVPNPTTEIGTVIYVVAAWHDLAEMRTWVIQDGVDFGIALDQASLTGFYGPTLCEMSALHHERTVI